MKKIIAVLILGICSFRGYSMCASNGLALYPHSKSIRQNSVFILEGYAQSQEVIRNLNKKHRIYLKNGKEEIDLLGREICVGQFRLTQAVLYPERELRAGAEYTVFIDSLPAYQKFQKWNTKLQKHEPYTYSVLSEKDLQAPEIRSTVKEIDKELIYYGCGPSIHVIFNYAAKDQSEVFVRTTVKDLSTGQSTTYYVSPDREGIRVGHDMCSGAFDFGNSKEFEVMFSYMDASGNSTASNGEKLRFTPPTKETLGRDKGIGE